MLALLRDPAQWSALVDDPGRAAAVVEETLRFDPPVQMTSRVAAEDMTVGGVRAKGDIIMMLLLAGAQRDPPATTTRTGSTRPWRHPAPGVRAGPALLPGCPAGPAGGRDGADGVGGEIPAGAAGGRAGLQTERHPAGMVALPVTV